MDLFFSTFSARAIWTPELIIVLSFISLLYYLITTKFRHVFPDSAPVSYRRKIYFHLGLVAIYLGLGGPLYVLGHLMLSMHMISMAIVFLIAPPLLIIGIPSWFFGYFSRFTAMRRVFTIVGFPILGLLLFNAIFSFYHLPFVFDFLKTNEGWHDLYQIGMLLAAMLMWWHILPRFETKYHLSELKRMGYMFASGVLFTPACALIIFAGYPLYATYTDPATWAVAIAYCLPAGAEIPFELFTGGGSLQFLTPLNDQQFGGAMMKIIQEITYGVAIGYTFRIWMKRDKDSTKEIKYQEYEMYQTNG